MNCITPFFNKHIHLAPQLFTFMDNYAKNKKNILTGKIMSNSNEPNTDEQIAQLDQKLRAMNTSANQNSAYEAADPQDPLFAQHAEEYENHTLTRRRKTKKSLFPHSFKTNTPDILNRLNIWSGRKKQNGQDKQNRRKLRAWRKNASIFFQSSVCLF